MKATEFNQEFKEFLENEIHKMADFEEQPQSIENLELEYKEYFIILDCCIIYEYIKSGGNGYDEPNDDGYEIKNIEFLSLKIYDKEDLELNEKEINKIISFLNNEHKPFKISGVKTKEILTRLINTEFDKFTEPWQTKSQLELIATAKQYGLTELANELAKYLK